MENTKYIDENKAKIKQDMFVKMNMSPIKVKVTGQNFLYEWEALVTRNLYAKYEGSN